MNIIICGAGEVGTHTAEVLAAKGNNITVIDLSVDRLRTISDNMDVGTLTGNVADAQVLREAGAPHADLLVAATSSDEINLLCASVGKALGATRTIARIHSQAYFEPRGLDYQTHFGIDHVICPEFATATAIARTMRNPAAIAIEHFAQGKIDMQEFPVSSGTTVLGRTLAEVGLPQGVRIAAVTRGREVFIPDASTALKPGDKIVLVGNTDVFFDVRRLIHPDSSARRKVVIMGGPVMATWLCRALKERNWSIRLFEKDRKLAQELAERLDWVTVIAADPTDQSVYEEEQIGQADVFVGLSEDDEDNIIGGVLAKVLGVTQVIAIVQRSQYLDLLYHIGVDRAFSPRMVAAREIESILDEQPLRLLASLAEGQIDAFQVRVEENAPISGKPLREVRLTPDWVIAAIKREDRIWVPGADDSIVTGDVVLVIGRHGDEAMLKKLFLN